MSEVISFRISDELTTKFKEFCQENNLKSPAAFEMMLNTVELENAKGKIASREAEINDFQHHAYCLNRSYLNALEMCENAEAKIRIEFAKQLDSQLDTIADLREKLKLAEEARNIALEEAKVMVENSKEVVKNAEAERDNTLKQVVELSDQLAKLDIQLKNDAEMVALWKDRAEKSETEAEGYKEAKVIIEELKNTIVELKNNIKDNNNNHALKLKEIELQHEKELSDIKSSMKDMITAKELELSNYKNEADHKYFEAQQKSNEESQKLKDQNKDLINEIEKLKEKLAKQEDNKEKKEEKKQPSDEEGEQLSLL